MLTGSPIKRDQWFVWIWKKLTTPAADVLDPQERRQAYLLAVLHVICMPFGILVAVVSRLLSPSMPAYEGRALPGFAILLALLLVTYGLSRTSRYQLGASIAFSAASVYLYAVAALGLTSMGYDVLYFLVILIIGFNLFFSLRLTLRVVLAHLVVLFLLPAVVENATLELIFMPAACLVMGSCLIILTRYQTELTEKEQERQVHLITDNVRDIVSHLDTNGIILYMSPSIQTVLGYPADMALGQSFRGWLTMVYPEDASIVERTFLEMLHAGGIRTAQYRMRHAEGHYVWLEGLSSTVIDPNGSVSGIILVTRDITVRKEAEEALQASEAKFRTLSDTIDAGVIISQGMKLAFMNSAAERLLGYSLEELRDAGSLFFVHPDHQGILEKRNAARLAGDTDLFRTEMKIVTKSGQTRWIYVSSVLIEYEHAPATMATFFDITENKQAEEQRLELALEREKVLLLQQFIGDLSHDLRNPLATIGTSLYLLNKAHTSEKRQYHQDVIAGQMKHLERVLADLSSISELDRQGEIFLFKPLNLHQLVEDAAQEYVPAAAEKRRTFSYSVSPDIPLIRGDYQQLRRALSNLINNALTYTLEGGQITCTVEPVENEVRIIIQDNGIGIRTEDLPYIFDHFYRGDKARNTDTGGAGLGLTIARRIIVAHGGEIDIQSELGAGSKVQISLPVLTPDISQTNPPA